MDERQGGEDKRYAELVGDRLRRIRQERGMSLQEVCARSGGSFVVSTLSAYERGKRSLSLERLYELASIYGQTPTSVLDFEGDARFHGPATGNPPLRISLDSLNRLDSEERRPLETYLAFLRELRQDPAREVLTVRKEDLAYLSALYGVRPQALKDYLEKEGVLLTW
jgi:transcriptional regulator with XRE-family HTH domain